MQKGLQNLDNPVLRGSYILVLSVEQIENLETITKKAFNEILDQSLANVTPTSRNVNTLHLTTDPGGVQDNRPGVYIIRQVVTGFCIVGQTLDLKARFNQYTSRSARDYSAAESINKNFYNAVQEVRLQDLRYNQTFQRLVVYTWVDNENNPLDVGNSSHLKNEMNYLEHRLILAFFASGLSFNVNDVPPQLSDVNAVVQFVPEPDSPQAGSTQAKALKWRGLFFLVTLHT